LRTRQLAAERGCKLFEAEEELLGTSHAEIGAYLLGLWGLPNIAVEAIAHHHRPDRISHSGFDCTVAVYMADLLEEELEAHPQGATNRGSASPIGRAWRRWDFCPGFQSSANSRRRLVFEGRRPDRLRKRALFGPKFLRLRASELVP
jgi:HD-like signal output (HDOD) protein